VESLKVESLKVESLKVESLKVESHRILALDEQVMGSEWAAPREAPVLVPKVGAVRVLGVVREVVVATQSC
jgi:hypothetical protein